MAEWVQIEGDKNCEVWEITLTAADPDSDVLGLDNQKSVSVALSSTGGASCSVNVTLQDQNDASIRYFVYESSASTQSGNDWIRGAISGLGGLYLQGSISDAQTVVAQVMQTARK